VEEKIRVRLAAVEKERDDFVEKVEKQLIAYNSIIAELYLLLKDDDEEVAPEPTDAES